MSGEVRLLLHWLSHETLKKVACRLSKLETVCPSQCAATSCGEIARSSWEGHPVNPAVPAPVCKYPKVHNHKGPYIKYVVVFWLLFQLLSAWVYGRVVGGVFNHCHLCKCTVQPLLPSPKLQFKSPIYSIYTFISNELNLIIYICTTTGNQKH